MINSRGQISETMTWVVATAAIVVVLFISIYVSSVSDLLSLDRKVSYSSDSSLAVTKSLTAYLMTEGNFEEFRKSDFDKDDFDKEFFKSVFYDLYKEFYSREMIYFGIRSEACVKGLVCGNSGALFGSGPLTPSETGDFYSEQIKLNDIGDETENVVAELMLN